MIIICREIGVASSDMMARFRCKVEMFRVIAPAIARLVGVLGLLGCLLMVSVPAEAQDSRGLVWARPVQLSGPGEKAFYAVITADNAGFAHIFWVEQPRAQHPGALMYARADCSSVPKPVDIMAGKPYEAAFLGAPLVDDRGQLYLPWRLNVVGPLYLSSVPVSEAGISRAWSPPRMIDDSVVGAGLVFKPGSGLFMNYVQWQGDTTTLFLCYSSDGGVTWSNPKEIDSLTDPKFRILSASLFVSKSGRLHLVWNIRPELFDGKTILYAYSDDNGQTWSWPFQVDSKDDRYSAAYGPLNPSLAQDGEGILHLVWMGAPAGQRYERVSRDDGKTWSPANQIWSNLRGITGANIMRQDGAGNLHMVTGAMDGLLYYSNWNGKTWLGPFTVNPGAKDSQSQGLAITRGNTLHAVWVDTTQQSIWYSWARLPLPAQPVVTYPPPLATATRQASPTASALPSPTKAVAVPGNLPSGSLPVSDTQSISLVTGLIAAGLVVCAVIASRLISRNRQW